MEKENDIPCDADRGRIDFTVRSESGSDLSCVLTEGRKKTVDSPVKGADVDPGVLVLVHDAPLGHRGVRQSPSNTPTLA
eukprot:1817176-Prymnesium_polylepis.2